ncbi:hypothetical protein AYI69_g4307 [Smittium culicis]|uniref:Uncharacterized protein n=1 Tax=Smittium culicis TaxID=133412 RepID=A0A1R1YEP7_9FUNG|nr:hypothetical protein AYI69_g4307 [Smittium culicis]
MVQKTVPTATCSGVTHITGSRRLIQFSAAIQEGYGRRRTCRTYGGSFLATDKERDRTSEITEPGTLQQHDCSSKEEMGLRILLDLRRLSLYVEEQNFKADY